MICYKVVIYEICKMEAGNNENRPKWRVWAISKWFFKNYCTISIDSARGVTCDTSVAFWHSGHLQCDLWQTEFSTRILLTTCTGFWEKWRNLSFDCLTSVAACARLHNLKESDLEFWKELTSSENPVPSENDPQPEDIVESLVEDDSNVPLGVLIQQLTEKKVCRSFVIWFFKAVFLNHFSHATKVKVTCNIDQN